MKNTKTYLPIGSVVLLNGGDKRLMVIGQGHVDVKTKQIYDYCGCLFPEGYLSADSNYLFNDDQIERIFFIGLQDSEQLQYVPRLAQLISNHRKTE